MIPSPKNAGDKRKAAENGAVKASPKPFGESLPLIKRTKSNVGQSDWTRNEEMSAGGMRLVRFNEGFSNAEAVVGQPRPPGSALSIRPRHTRSADEMLRRKELFGFRVEELYDYDMTLSSRVSSQFLTSMSPRYRKFAESNDKSDIASRSDEQGPHISKGQSSSKREVTAPSKSEKPKTATVSLPIIREALLGDNHSAELNTVQEAAQSSSGKSAKFMTMMDQDMAEADGLMTGSDAIAFFAKHGQNSPIKFVYLNRGTADDKVFRPYDLIVCSREEVDPEHFTMSASGVVHIKPGQPSEFIPLGEWVRQSTMFNVLTSIRFFKFYLPAKAFRIWRSNIRYKLYCLQRNKLIRRLFFAKSSFCATLMDINKSWVETLKNVRLMLISMKTPYLPENFNDQQMRERNTASKAFEKLIDTLQGMLEKVCEDVNARARTTDDILLTHSAENPEESGTVQALKTARGERMKSMVAIKQEQIERTKALKRAAEEAQQLGDFIRVGDYMIVENLGLLAINTMDEFLKLIKESRKQGLFNTQVQYGPQGMLFSPSHEDISNLVSNMADAIIATVNLVPRLLYMRPFKPYFQGQSIVGPKIKEMIEKSEKWGSLRKDIENVISKDFAQAAQYASKNFEEYRPIYTFGEQWSYDEYCKEERSVKQFRLDMEKMKKFQQDLDRMKLGQVCGVLQVDSKPLKNSLLPITTRCLDQMKQLLLQSAKEKCIEITNDLQGRIKQLQDRPQRLKDFADFVSCMNNMKEDAKLLGARVGTVNDMYDLLGKFEVKVPHQDQVKLDTLKDTHEAFQDAMIQAGEQVEQKMPFMSGQLSREVQNLNDKLLTMLATLHAGDYVDGNADPELVLEKLGLMKKEIDQLAEKANTFSGYQKLFKLAPHDDTSHLPTTLQAYEQKVELWSSLHSWEGLDRQWRSADFSKLNVEDMSTTVQTYYKNAYRMWSKQKESDEVAKRLKESVEIWRNWMPMILELGNKALKPRHWEKIFRVLGQTYLSGLSFTLDQLIRWSVFDHRDLISEISSVASGEYALELALEKIRNGWSSMEFSVISHRESKDVFILGGVDEITQLLEDNQVTLQTMLASRFVVGIRDEIESWDKKLALLSDSLDEWLTCQRAWMYLECIFNQPDIQKQLPTEATKFIKVDTWWKDHMRRTRDNPNVIQAACAPGVLEMLIECNRLLEEIQKSLEEYLETKRVAFPRFYFLSNDELLEILSQTRDPKAVQPHMRKCFDSIMALDFSPDSEDHEVMGMISAENEYVKFSSCVFAKGPVENWLLDIEGMMRMTLYDQMKGALKAYSEETRQSWFFDWPAQCTLTVDQIVWTHNVECALDAMKNQGDKLAINKFKEFSVRELDKMVALVRGSLTPLQRACMGSLIVIDVHARDVVDILMKAGSESVNDFDWIRQLRYYWEEDVDNCVVRQTNSSFLYGFEYLGNQPRLVITPLTDKCYMTLTGALHLKLGGAPAGPAGTGKTETTKDLGKALARQVVVFNCSDGLDYKMMGRFFSGLSQAGAWACFDEFNRIDIEVLSVIAQQCLTIQQALTSHADRFVFEGREIAMSPNYGCFITMNPGYAGRTELPDNLKALFRPVAMMVPDYALIAEIMLFSEGFTNAKNLARKMTQLYKLSSEQLSSQDHYDFGMRAVKSVLVMAGSLKRDDPDTNEDTVLIRALRDSNVPKFLADDIPLFQAIIQDLFPGVNIPSIDYGDLQKGIESQLSKAKLQVVPSIVTKTIQLFETMLVRHGVMTVGFTGTGKSTIISTLAEALTQLRQDGSVNTHHQRVQRHILNPKSITMGELYGEFNLVSNEWTDGLIASIVRQCVVDDTPDKKWVIFDGPVDALWIENMNTVLDDNKTLCLANGERIKLPRTMTMLFEVNDLAVASPATVSRCGMVFLESVYLPWKALARSWAENIIEPRLPGLSSQILQMLDVVVDPALKFVRSEGRENIPSTNVGLVQGLLNLLDSLLRREYGVALPDELSKSEDAFSSSVPPNFQVLPLVKLYVIFAIIWSIGANLHDSSLLKFDQFLKPCLMAIMSDFPEDGTIYDYCVDKETCTFVSWITKIPEFKYDSSIPYFNILVPTTDTTRLSFVLSTLINGGHHVLVTGNSGVGKSVIVQDFLANLDKEKVLYACNTFSAQTSSRNLQDLFEDKLEKRRKNLLGPIAGKKMILFIDDLNMPLLEAYGAQPPIELLRQVMGQGGFYDRKKLFFKQVADTQFIAACGPPGGGRNNVTPRIVRFFHLINIPDLSTHSMQRVFASILTGFLSEGFPDELLPLANPMVLASVSIYTRITSELLPTPSKSHYTFNLRDLSKIVQGILQVLPKHCTDADTLLKLWCHESARVFQDRLINEQDKAWFDALLQEMLKANFQVEWDVSVFKDLLFGDYLTREEKEYRQITDFEDLGRLFSDYLADYEMEYNKSMNLVFFRDAIEHTSRISRIIRQPRGNALLVGVGGSGRQSLTKLAAHMSLYKCFQIELSRGYGQNEFREDLKKVLMMAGAEDKQVVFLFSDTQIVKESFLEDINNILNAGEVPNLFQKDELEKIVNDVRPRAKAAGKTEARDAVYGYFVQLVRENLHMVITMSPIGDAFRNRLRMFPSLVNCCTIDWFTKWPDDALFSVATRFFNQLDLGGPEASDKVASMCVRMHRSVGLVSERFYDELRRHNYTTPTSYLELLNLYVIMLQEQRTLLTGKASRLRGGLDKIAKAKVIVDRLREELKVLQPVLERSAQETANLLVEVAGDQKAADEARSIVEEETTKVAAATEEANEIRNDAQADLDEAMPAYYAAVKALKSLNKNDITEVKSFAKPPALVMTVMEAVCLLKGVKPTWDDSKRLLSAPDFLQSLENYDKDNIPDVSIQKLKKYINNPEFQPLNVEKVSRAAKSLCQWVLAINTYARVAKQVEPKRKKLAEAEASVAAMQQMLEEKQSRLAEVQAKVAMLQEKYERSLRKRDELEGQRKLTLARLDRAEKLINLLGGEQDRWVSTADRYDEERGGLVGSMLLAAACIAYVGPFTASFRKELLETWNNDCIKNAIPVDKSFSIERALADPVQVREWIIQGLPADQLSTENALFVTKGRRWPLMIDPQGQANRWIKNMERANNLQVIKLSEATFLRTLENCIRVGTPVLLENVGEVLDPALEPVLLKQTFKSGGRLLIRLGDTDVDYSPDFKFYITTKLANPHYPPEICIKATIVNFTVTRRGLEDQLLVDVVKHERPELEEQKDKLVVQIAAGQKQLKDLEDKILQLLAAAGDNILDDDLLVSTLADSKATSTEINRGVEIAEKTAKDIDVAREAYRSVATRGSILYFVVADFAMVDPMYQYSLTYFSQLFNQCLEKAERASDLFQRLKTLIEFITEYVYVNICRGLFEKDKMLFSFLSAVQVLREDGIISQDEWNFFLRGSGGMVDENRVPPNPSDNWLPYKSWIDMQLLNVLPPFTGLIDSVVNDNTMWRAIYESDSPHEELLPGVWNEKLKDFQKLLILKLFREEKLVFGIPRYVRKILGEKFIESPPFDLETSFQASNSKTPIIFVLSSGADPTSYLLNLAQSLGYQNRLKIISLGQGQGPIAEALIETARKIGDWVCLQNCHLAASWMPSLEKLLEQMQTMDIHSDFRLWLTSMPTPKFPVTVLQNGIKLTNEPPRGLKSNLTRTFLDINEQQFETCSKLQPWKKLLFGLAFYHAVIMERRKFGSVGWNIPYEWNQSDLQVSIQQLHMYLEEQPDVPYQTLNYIVADINYGGRITDMWDQRCARSVLVKYFCAEITNDSYNFTDDGYYKAPPAGDLKSFRDFIAALPLTDSPEIFGLHKNADITYQKKETKAMLDTIVSIQPRAGAGGKGANRKGPDEIVLELAADVQSRLPHKLDRREGAATTFSLDSEGAMNSLGTFLSIEMGKFNKLITIMEKTLVDLQRAIKGLVVMSSDLEKMYDAFLYQKVPHQWTAVSYPSLKPLASWVKDLIERVTFLQEWLQHGPPMTYWLSGFFFPQGFMTGVLQMHARKTKIPIDTLSFRAEVLDATKENIQAPPENGVYMYGLFMEGARWDKYGRCVSESEPGELFTQMPVIWLDPVVAGKPPQRDMFQCSLYKTLTRAGTLSTTGHSTNFVTTLDLPSRMHPDHWIRRGCALLLALDD